MISSARLAVGRLAVGGGAPGVGDAAAVRRARQVEAAAASRSRANQAACSASSVISTRPRPAPRAARSATRRAGAARGLDPEVDDRRALDDRLVAEDDDDGRVADRRERRAEGVEPVRDVLGQHGRVRAEARAQELRRARRPARPSRCRRARSRSRSRRRAAAARPRRARRPSRAARSGAGRPCAAGRRSGRRRAGAPNAKRPLSQSQPSSTSGWLRERIRLTLPSRVVALMLQPTGQRPQTVGTFWISHGRASKRYCVEVSAPTGQSSITLPEKRRAVRLVLEGGDHRLRAAVDRDELPVLGDRLARSACSGSRGCSARGRARSSARSGSASRTCASGTSCACCPGP